MLLKIMPGHLRQPENFPLITMNAIWPGPIFTSESSKHFENGVNHPRTHQNYRGQVLNVGTANSWLRHWITRSNS